MTIVAYKDEFAGMPVKDWPVTEKAGFGRFWDILKGKGDEFDPSGTIYRLGLSYEECEANLQWSERLNAYLDQPGAEKTRGIVVGAWSNLVEGDDSSAMVEALVKAQDRLPNLAALFLGDVTFEDCEISWITQTDVSPIFAAYPRLEHFGVRGGNDLKLGAIRHDSLRTLIVETGGLPRTVVIDVINSSLPALEHLELWLGSDSYGADATVEDIYPILFREIFPKMKYLGLRNSEIANELARALKGAPILDSIDILDLSMSTITDEGGLALLNNPKLLRLKKLDLHYHYLSQEMMKRLKDMPIEVDVSDRQEEDEDMRFCAVSE